MRFWPKCLVTIRSCFNVSNRIFLADPGLWTSLKYLGWADEIISLYPISYRYKFFCGSVCDPGFVANAIELNQSDPRGLESVTAFPNNEMKVKCESN